jgi:hypothetical protein
VLRGRLNSRLCTIVNCYCYVSPPSSGCTAVETSNLTKFICYFSKLISSEICILLLLLSSSSHSLSNKLKRIQKTFTSVCFIIFLGLHSIHKKRHYLDALIFVQVYRGLKSCISLIGNVSLRVPPQQSPGIPAVLRLSL